MQKHNARSMGDHDAKDDRGKASRDIGVSDNGAAVAHTKKRARFNPFKQTMRAIETAALITLLTMAGAKSSFAQSKADTTGEKAKIEQLRTETAAMERDVEAMVYREPYLKGHFNITTPIKQFKDSNGDLIIIGYVPDIHDKATKTVAWISFATSDGALLYLDKHNDGSLSSVVLNKSDYTSFAKSPQDVAAAILAEQSSNLFLALAPLSTAIEAARSDHAWNSGFPFPKEFSRDNKFVSGFSEDSTGFVIKTANFRDGKEVVTRGKEAAKMTETMQGFYLSSLKNIIDESSAESH